MPRANSLTLTPFLLALAVVALVYGSMTLTHHAKQAHAGEMWQAVDIATYLDCHPNDVMTTPTIDGYEKHWCQVNRDKAVGLIIAAGGIIITGFMAGVNYWKRRQ